MTRNRKIKAFTLSEMIVVIGLTGIIAGLAFSIMHLVQQHMKKITFNYEEKTQWHLLEQSLWMDFHRYQNISYHPEMQQLQFSHGLDTIAYIFTADKIIKERDTFHIAVTGKKCYYKGKMIPQGRLDALELQTATGQEQQHKTLFVFNTTDVTHTINAWHFN